MTNTIERFAKQTAGTFHQTSYEIAREHYATLGVNTDQALARLDKIALSLHCWQGDDVGGFENPGGELTGGIAATGNYPGKARNAEELRKDLDLAYSLLPGSHRLNLHAIYLESDHKVERNAIEPRHFTAWKDWAKAGKHGVDFNPTCFSHPLANDGFTLAHRDPSIRQFWIEHCIASRKIGEYFGQELGTPAVTTRGMGAVEMQRIAHWIGEIKRDAQNTALQEHIHGEVIEMCTHFPVPA